MNSIENRDFLVTDGHFGSKLVLKSSFSDSIRDYMIQENIYELELNWGKDWPMEPIDFLDELPFLINFEILELRMKDVSPINNLHNLKALTVETYCSTEINFNNFPNIEYCFMQWRPMAKSLFECNSLKFIRLDNFKIKDSYVFRKLTNLEMLRIGNGPLPDVVGIG